MNPLPPAGSDCCVPDCTDVTIQQVPGPAGPPGASCSPCSDGENAYTQLTAGFTMPAEGGDVEIEVLNSDWMTPGQEVFVEFAGTFQVVSKADSTHAVITNLKDTGAGTYADNVPPGTSIPNGSNVSPAGLQGPEGTIPAGILDTISPTMQKGDILVDDGANSPGAHLVRHGVSADGTTLHADSSTSDGVRWAKVDLTDPAEVILPLTTKGDLLGHNGTWIDRLGVGTDGNVLIADSSQGLGLKWGAFDYLLANGDFNGSSAGGGIDYTLTGSYEKVTFVAATQDLAVTLPSTGTYLVIATIGAKIGTGFGANGFFKLYNETAVADVQDSEVETGTEANQDEGQVTISKLVTTGSDYNVIQVYGYSDANGGTVFAAHSRILYVKLS